MSEFYPDLENNYPSKIDEYNPLSDVTASTYDIVKQYETYLSLGNERDENGFTGLQKAAKYKEENPILEKMIINAKKYNILQQMIISTQRFARSLKFQTIFSLSQPDDSDKQMNGGIWAKIKETLENGEKKVLLKLKDNDLYYNFYPQTTGDQVIFEDGDNCENLKSAIESFEKKTDNNFKKIIDIIYPIGSIYTSTADVSPESFIGGEWIPIKDTFLLCAGDKYEAGSSGGNAVKSVPVPVHSHRYTPSGSVSSTFSGTATSHTHTGPSHQHDLQNHVHSGPNHQHSFAGNTGESGSHKHQLHVITPNATGSYSTNYVQFGKDQGTQYVNGGAMENAGTHSHYISGDSTWSGTGNTGGPSTNATGWAGNGNTGEASITPAGSVSSTFKGTAGTTENAGTDATIDIMPPYKTVYAWERVS